MSERTETRLPLAAMRESFRQHYARCVSFREDAALLDRLELEASPVLEELFTAYAQPAGCPALHEAYALLALLAREAAQLGATPSTSLALTTSLIGALSSVGVELSDRAKSELSSVAVEGYCAARDERVTSELRKLAAERQVELAIAPHCVAIFLSGRHEAEDLLPTLDRMARTLLHQDARSCLLDLSRLDAADEDVARAVGHFCAGAATLGVATFVVGASERLRARFESWGVAGGSSLQFADDLRRALTSALAAAGFELRPVRQWAQLLHRRRRIAT